MKKKPNYNVRRLIRATVRRCSDRYIHKVITRCSKDEILTAWSTILGCAPDGPSIKRALATAALSPETWRPSEESRKLSGLQ